MRRVTRHHLLLGLIILIGFALRVCLADDITLSPDERNVTNEFLRIPFSALLQATTRHGFPEHIFAGIFIWLAYNFWGWQLLLLRWPGIFFGVLALPALYVLARKLIGVWYALAATLLLALSWYHVYSSQQIRGYAHMVFFGVVSFYFLWQGLTKQRWRDWILFGLVSALSLYNQLFIFTLLAAQGLLVAFWLLVRVWQQRPQPLPFFRREVMPPLAAGGLGILLAGLLFAPLLPQFFQHSVAADSDFPVAASSVTETLLPYIALFDSFSGAFDFWSRGLFLGLILLGAIFLLRLKPAAAVLLLGWLLIPLLLVVVGQLIISWFYVRDRYLIYTLPVFPLLMAVGWLGLFEILRKLNPLTGLGYLGLSFILVAGVSAAAVTGYLQTATSGNWAAVSDFLVKNRLPTDMVMCEPYGHGWKEVDLPATDDCTRSLTYRLSEQTEIIYPFYNLFTVANWDALTASSVLLQRNPRVWVVVWGIPEGVNYQQLAPAAVFQRLGRTVVLGPISSDNIVASLTQAVTQVNSLAENPETQFALLTRLADLQAAAGQTEAARQTLAQAKTLRPDDPQAEAQVAGVEQHLSRSALVVAPAHPAAVVFGGQIQFGGYSVSPDPLMPGQPARLTLFWQGLAAIDKDYSIFLHLRDEANQTVAQLDVAPQSPTSSWWAGDRLHNTVDFQVPAQLPPGRYRLLLGLYNLQTLERLPIAEDSSGENAVEIMELVIPH